MAVIAWLICERSATRLALFGSTASPSTAFRVIDRIATTPGLLDAVGDAHSVGFWICGSGARARARVWELVGAPPRLTIDLDATLIADALFACELGKRRELPARGFGLRKPSSR